MPASNYSLIKLWHSLNYLVLILVDFIPSVQLVLTLPHLFSIATSLVVPPSNQSWPHSSVDVLDHQLACISNQLQISTIHSWHPFLLTIVLQTHCINNPRHAERICSQLTTIFDSWTKQRMGLCCCKNSPTADKQKDGFILNPNCVSPIVNAILHFSSNFQGPQSWQVNFEHLTYCSCLIYNHQGNATQRQSHL